MARERHTRYQISAMYAVLLLLTFLFFAAFFNRFAGVRSGDGEYTGGLALLQGRLPYRDYFTAGPPLNVIKSAILLKLFGKALIVSRAAAVAERMLIAAVLFRWLLQIFPASSALVASVVTIAASAADGADPLASYNHDAILFAMLSGLAGSVALDATRRSQLLLCAAVAGVFSALSLATKQTVGIGVLVTVLLVGALLSLRSRSLSRSLAWSGAFLAGAAVPLALLAVVLQRLGILHPFLRMLFVQGPAAKATHAGDFVRREFLVARDNLGWLVLGSFALLLAWPSLRRFLANHVPGVVDESERWSLQRQIIAILCVGASTIGLAVLLAHAGIPALHDFCKSCVYFAFLGIAGLSVIYVSISFRTPLTRETYQSILFCLVSWSIAATLSLSWPAFEAMLLPGLGFLIAAVLTCARRKSLPFVYAALAGVLFMATSEKLDRPFAFDGHDEQPTRTAVAFSSEPQLRGMRLPAATVRFLDETSDLIRTQTKPGDTIFTYPEMGLLYGLTGRDAPTLSGSHNIDVINDSFATEEAERLLHAPPAVIVYSAPSLEKLQGEERLWRHGRPSGQRQLIAAVQSLIARYQLAGRYRLAPHDPEISVFVRP